MGNPVKFGSGPAAVTPLCYRFFREPFWPRYATVSTDRDGKAAKRAGESEDLPYQYVIALRATEIEAM